MRDDPPPPGVFMRGDILSMPCYVWMYLQSVVVVGHVQYSPAHATACDVGAARAEEGAERGRGGQEVPHGRFRVGPSIQPPITIRAIVFHGAHATGIGLAQGARAMGCRRIGTGGGAEIRNFVKSSVVE